MACSFCLTGESSQDGRAGTPLDPDSLGDRLAGATPQVRSVTILGGEPSIHLAGALEIAARVPESIQLVWKTNAYASDEGRDILDGIPDVVLADYKFGDDRCALGLAGIPDYTRTVRANLRWAARTSRLIVRHLVMPGHVDCCLVGVAEWLRTEMPETPLSLMTGFLPVFRAAADSALGRTNRAEECRRALESVRLRGLRTVPWVLAPGPGPAPSRPDELWIDPAGRICVDSASPELVFALKRMGPEFVLVP
jgi:putative pyruvate formate lyase activating enzyme